MPTHEVTLDFNKSITLIQPEIIVRVGDADSQVIQATLYDDGIPYTPTGELRIQIERRDGGLIITRPMSTVSTNVYRATLPAVACAWHGESRQAYVAEYRDGKVYATSSSFKLKILPGSTTAEAIKFFDEELQEIRDLAGEAGSQVTKNEEARQEAERTRAQAEQARKTAEESREEAESGRESAESSRESSERSRESAESSRKSAERTRESQESTRQSNESDRERAESSRESAEQARSEAEQTRESAETKREAYYTQLKSDVDAGEYDGATFTPSVDDLGNISWTNDRELPNPETKNITGPRGLTGDKGETGDQGPKGDTGATFTPTVTENGDLTWENDKELENPQKVNIKGPKGDKGDIGEGLKVLGVYASLDEIKQHHESGERVGDAYMGGANYYVWDGTQWQDCGELQGAKGEPGPAGADGEPGKDGAPGGYYTPSVSEEGILTWAGSKEDMPPVPEASIKGPAGEGGADFATDEEINSVKPYIGAHAETIAGESIIQVDASTPENTGYLSTELTLKITNKTSSDLTGITVKIAFEDDFHISELDDAGKKAKLSELEGKATEQWADTFGAPGWSSGTEREITTTTLDGILPGGDNDGWGFSTAEIYVYYKEKLAYACFVVNVGPYEVATVYPFYYTITTEPETSPKIEKTTRPDQVVELINAGGGAGGDYATDADIEAAKALIGREDDSLDPEHDLSINIDPSDGSYYKVTIVNNSGRTLNGISVKYATSSNVNAETPEDELPELSPETFGTPWPNTESRTASFDNEYDIDSALIYVYYKNIKVYVASYNQYERPYGPHYYPYTAPEPEPILKHTRPDQVAELVNAGMGSGGGGSVEFASDEDIAALKSQLMRTPLSASQLFTIKCESTGEKCDITITRTNHTVEKWEGITVKVARQEYRNPGSLGDLVALEEDASEISSGVFGGTSWAKSEERTGTTEGVLDPIDTTGTEGGWAVFVYYGDSLALVLYEHNEYWGSFGEEYTHWYGIPAITTPDDSNKVVRISQVSELLSSVLASVPVLEGWDNYYLNGQGVCVSPTTMFSSLSFITALVSALDSYGGLGNLFKNHAQDIQDALNTLSG